jgi:aspartate/methionine/tyrosine aminotransferase
MANGFTYDNPEWGNMGQGAPEVGDLPLGTERPKVINLEEMGEWVNEYAPTAGVRELREAVAVSLTSAFGTLTGSIFTTQPIGKERRASTRTRMCASSLVGVRE